jgi:hypothetical protein
MPLSHLAPYYPPPPGSESQSDYELSISDWSPADRHNSIIGSFSVTLLPSGLMLRRLMVNRSKRGGPEWIGIPGAPAIQGGQLKRAVNGSIVYHALVGFAAPVFFEEFQTLVLEELRRCGHI